MPACRRSDATLGSTGYIADLNRVQREAGYVRTTYRSSRKARDPVDMSLPPQRRTQLNKRRAYENLGADGILAILEAYFPLKDPQIESYFRAIADAVGVPVVLYTKSAQFQRSDLSLDHVIARLSEHPRIEYIKDASTNTGRLLFDHEPRATDESVFGFGAYSGPAQSCLNGGVGWMAGLSHASCRARACTRTSCAAARGNGRRL